LESSKRSKVDFFSGHYLVVVGFALDLFGAHVELRADLVGVAVEGREGAGAGVVARRVDEGRLLRHGRHQAEVADLDGTVGREEDVGRLQVAVDQTLSPRDKKNSVKPSKEAPISTSTCKWTYSTALMISLNMCKTYGKKRTQ